MKAALIPIRVVIILAVWAAAGLLGYALATIDLGSCSHHMIPCRDAGARFIPPSI